MIALAAGVFVALIGRIVPDLHFLYEYAWFVGFGVAALLYVVLMGSARSVGGATPLAQRIAVKGWTMRARQSGAGAKARSATV